MWGRDARVGIACFQVFFSFLFLRDGAASAQNDDEHDLPPISVLGRFDPDLIAAVNEVVPRARRKLQATNCQTVFAHFRDASGNTLLENLETKNQSAAVYLRWLVFLNGSEDQFCLNSHIAAGTNPGDRFVRLCGPLFKSLAKRDSEYAAALIIHEELHALGLPENPPSSDEITRQVIARCGQ